MTDRRKIAVLLVVLGGVLAGVGSTLDMYTEVQSTSGEGFTYTVSLWGARSNLQGFLDSDTVLDDGLPITVAAALMVVAAVLTLRDGRIAAVARPSVLAAAGVFAGLVLAFAVGALRRSEVAQAFSESSPWRYEQDLLPGFHLLVVAAVAGLAGALLAQRAQPVAAEPAEEEAVVVHQIVDDDTPPFGFAAQEQQEAR